MALKIIMDLINDSYLTVDEAIWLDKFIDLEILDKEDIYSTQLELIKNNLNKKKVENDFNNKYDELYIHSIINKITLPENLGVFTDDSIDEDIDDEEDDDDNYEDEEDDKNDNFFSKGLLEKLKLADENIINKGVGDLLSEYINFIEDKFPKAFNGFDKRELVKAKSLFIEEYLGVSYYYKLSLKAKTIIENVIEKSLPLLMKKSSEKETNLIPVISYQFKNWTTSTKIKPNKQNLKDFLKEKGLKISNSNQDRIIELTKTK